MIGKHQERTERAFQLAISRNSNGGASFTTTEKAQKALWEIAQSLAVIADALDRSETTPTN